MKTCFTLAAWAAALCIGCGGGSQSKSPGNQATSPPGPEATAPPGSGHVGNTKTQPKNVKRVEAKPGLTERGKGISDGPIGTPIKTLWRMDETIQLNIQRKRAEKLYKAMHDNKGPKSHEEYMKEVIKKNMVRLPKLPPGQSYVYDPEKEELFVEKPQ